MVATSQHEQRDLTPKSYQPIYIDLLDTDSEVNGGDTPPTPAVAIQARSAPHTKAPPPPPSLPVPPAPGQPINLLNRAQQAKNPEQPFMLLRTRLTGMNSFTRPCSVCRQVKSELDESTFFCDLCDVAMHLECVNLKKLPVEPYFCAVCQHDIRTGSIREDLKKGELVQDTYSLDLDLIKYLFHGVEADDPQRQKEILGKIKKHKLSVGFYKQPNGKEVPWMRQQVESQGRKMAVYVVSLIERRGAVYKALVEMADQEVKRRQQNRKKRQKKVSTMQLDMLEIEEELLYSIDGEDIEIWIAEGREEGWSGCHIFANQILEEQRAYLWECKGMSAPVSCIQPVPTPLLLPPRREGAPTGKSKRGRPSKRASTKATDNQAANGAPDQQSPTKKNVKQRPGQGAGPSRKKVVQSNKKGKSTKHKGREAKSSKQVASIAAGDDELEAPGQYSSQEEYCVQASLASSDDRSRQVPIAPECDQSLMPGQVAVTQQGDDDVTGPANAAQCGGDKGYGVHDECSSDMDDAFLPLSRRVSNPTWFDADSEDESHLQGPMHAQYMRSMAPLGPTHDYVTGRLNLEPYGSVYQGPASPEASMHGRHGFGAMHRQGQDGLGGEGEDLPRRVTRGMARLGIEGAGDELQACQHDLVAGGEVEGDGGLAQYSGSPNMGPEGSSGQGVGDDVGDGEGHGIRVGTPRAGTPRVGTPMPGSGVGGQQGGGGDILSVPKLKIRTGGFAGLNPKAPAKSVAIPREVSVAQGSGEDGGTSDGDGGGDRQAGRDGVGGDSSRHGCSREQTGVRHRAPGTGYHAQMSQYNYGYGMGQQYAGAAMNGGHGQWGAVNQYTPQPYVSAAHTPVPDATPTSHAGGAAHHHFAHCTQPANPQATPMQNETSTPHQNQHYPMTAEQPCTNMVTTAGAPSYHHYRSFTIQATPGNASVPRWTDDQLDFIVQRVVKNAVQQLSMGQGPPIARIGQGPHASRTLSGGSQGQVRNDPHPSHSGGPRGGSGGSGQGSERGQNGGGQGRQQDSALRNGVGWEQGRRANTQQEEQTQQSQELNALHQKVAKLEALLERTQGRGLRTSRGHRREQRRDSLGHHHRGQYSGGKVTQRSQKRFRRERLGGQRVKSREFRRRRRAVESSEQESDGYIGGRSDVDTSDSELVRGKRRDGQGFQGFKLERRGLSQGFSRERVRRGREGGEGCSGGVGGRARKRKGFAEYSELRGAGRYTQAKIDAKGKRAMQYSLVREHEHETDSKSMITKPANLGSDGEGSGVARRDNVAHGNNGDDEAQNTRAQSDREQGTRECQGQGGKSGSGQAVCQGDGVQRADVPPDTGSQPHGCDSSQRNEVYVSPQGTVAKPSQAKRSEVEQSSGEGAQAREGGGKATSQRAAPAARVDAQGKQGDGGQHDTAPNTSPSTGMDDSEQSMLLMKRPGLNVEGVVAGQGEEQVCGSGLNAGKDQGDQ